MRFIKRLYWRVHQHMFSRDFFPAGYLFIYKDVANANINPWEHYVKHGRRENRQRGNTPPSYFDKNVYLNLNPDVRASGIDAWHHYVLYGHAENRAYTSKEKPKVIQCEIKKPVKDETRSTSVTDEVDFSIIMPTYNRAYIMQNSIDSVLSQTYRNFELIIADDGSTDETESLIHTRYKAELDQGTIRYIKCPHRGVCATRNAALREVRKSWIAYVDSDNTIREHFLRTFADAIMEHPNTRSFYAKALITQTKVELGRDFDYSPLRHANYIDLGMFVHHVSLYRQHGGFDETLKRLVDWDLILKYTYEAPPYYIKKVVLDYNDDKGQVDRITMKNSLSDSLARVRQKARVKAVTTLIMVSYNEKLVRHAIESALMQEGNIEHHIIVIDNASSNDVREMCEHYAKTYPQIITLVRHKISISRTSIILNCIGLIKSDFVALMTADECWTDQHRLHKMTSFLDANTDCPLCFNSFLVLDDEKPVIRKVAEHDCLPYKLDVRDVKNLIDNSRTYWCDTVVIWKDVLEQMLLEASNNELEISTLLHHALKYGKIGYLRERMGVRRMVSSHSLKEGDAVTLKYNDDVGRLDRISVSKNRETAMVHVKRKHRIKSVTTCITTYNQENDLAQAIESALAQKGNIKQSIVIYDDCSTDGTEKVARSYAEKYPNLITYIRNEKNLGVSGNLERVFREAKGDYMAILEGDDYWLDEMRLHKMTTYLDCNPDCSMCFNKLYVYSVANKRFRFLKRQAGLPEKLDGWDILNTAYNNPIVNLTACVYRVSAIPSMPECIYDGVVSELSVALSMLRSGKVAFWNEPISVYRQHSKGVYSGLDKRKSIEYRIRSRQTMHDVAEDCYKPRLLETIDKLKKELAAL